MASASPARNVEGTGSAEAGPVLWPAQRTRRMFSIAVKRLIDVAVAAPGFLLLAPLLMIVLLALRMTLGRPVVFCQVRPGFKAKPFILYKFRTMWESYNNLNGTLQPEAERIWQGCLAPAIYAESE